MWETIKSLYVLNHRDNGLPLEPRFFETEKDAQEYYVVDICGQELEEDTDIKSEFEFLENHARDCGSLIYIETVEEWVKNYEALNDYNEEEFNNRDEYIKSEFYWLENPLYSKNNYVQ